MEHQVIMQTFEKTEADEVDLENILKVRSHWQGEVNTEVLENMDKRMNQLGYNLIENKTNSYENLRGYSKKWGIVGNRNYLYRLNQMAIFTALFSGLTVLPYMLGADGTNEASDFCTGGSMLLGAMGGYLWTLNNDVHHTSWPMLRGVSMVANMGVGAVFGAMFSIFILNRKRARKFGSLKYTTVEIDRRQG